PVFLITPPAPSASYTLSLHDALPIYASGIVTLQASLESVSTVPSGIPLADVAARQDATITLPDNYPTVTPVPVQLSELQGTEGVDRKSTRLNSSHVKISYAVFCLKKK